MEFSVRHFISGRIRLHLPSLCRKQNLLRLRSSGCKSQQGVKLARMNYACASLVIEYDPSFEGVLRGTLGRLSLMSLDDLRLLFDAGKNAQPSASSRLRCRVQCQNRRSGAARRSRCRPYRC